MGDPTIYDVAERAGVSIATVSRVLNSPRQVQEQTRARVQRAIDELSFVPRAEAAARARRAVGRVGVLAPFFTYPSFVQRLRGIAERLEDSQFELVIYNIDTATRRDAVLNSLALTRRIDGLIVVSLPIDEEMTQRMLQHQVATVLIEYAQRGTTSIEIDDRAGGRIAADYLIGQGHRRLGYIGDSEVPMYALFTSRMRLLGFRERIDELGLSLPDDAIGLTLHGMETARAATHRLLDLPEPPSAIFAQSDIQAMGAIKAAADRGLRIPEDLAVMGFDDIDIADFIGLTTIRQPLDESGRIAVDQLLQLIDDRTRTPQRVSLPLTMVQRRTA